MPFRPQVPSWVPWLRVISRPAEGAQVMAPVETYRRTLELTMIEERVRELEEVIRGTP